MQIYIYENQKKVDKSEEERMELNRHRTGQNVTQEIRPQKRSSKR